jgi:hypothetical protein
MVSLARRRRARVPVPDLISQVRELQAQVRDASAKMESEEAVRIERIRDKLSGLVADTLDFGDASDGRPSAWAASSSGGAESGYGSIAADGGNAVIGGIKARARVAARRRRPFARWFFASGFFLFFSRPSGDSVGAKMYVVRGAVENPHARRLLGRWVEATASLSPLTQRDCRARLSSFPPRSSTCATKATGKEAAAGVRVLADGAAHPPPRRERGVVTRGGSSRRPAILTPRTCRWLGRPTIHSLVGGSGNPTPHATHD